MKATVRSVDTPYGEGRMHTRRSTHPMATLLLSHGAGGGVESRDLWALAEALPAQGFSVVLFEQPWRVAGRKVATAPATLDAALTCAADVMRVRTPLVVGGRSAGARSAARTARRLGATGCLALSFPLHQPGRTEPTRLPELRGTGLPTLVIQGERDPMGRPEEFPADLRAVDMVVVPGADHGLKVPARGEVTQEEAMGIVVESTLEWLVREVVGNPRVG
ncbi:MAG: alpha/beta family hydrolase [Terrabacter sp.]